MSKLTDKEMGLNFLIRILPVGKNNSKPSIYGHATKITYLCKHFFIYIVTA